MSLILNYLYLDHDSKYFAMICFQRNIRRKVFSCARIALCLHHAATKTPSIEERNPVAIETRLFKSALVNNCSIEVNIQESRTKNLLALKKVYSQPLVSYGPMAAPYENTKLRLNFEA